MATDTAAARPPVPPHDPATDPYFYGWRHVARRRPDGTEYTERVPLTERDILFPQEDDFVVTNDAHDDALAYLKAAFRWRLAGRPGALVLSDHRIDFQVEGWEPLGPDVAVLFDAGPLDRLNATYPLRDKGARAALVIEVTSPSTRNTDLDAKVDAYYEVGVPLYVIADLRATAAGPDVRFIAYRATADGPVRLASADRSRVWLPDLDLWLTARGDRFVCLEPDEREIGDYQTVARQAQEAEARARAEKSRADAAEQRVQDLEAELARLRGGNPLTTPNT